MNDKHKVHSYNEVLEKAPSKYTKLANSKIFKLNIVDTINKFTISIVFRVQRTTVDSHRQSSSGLVLRDYGRQQEAATARSEIQGYV